MIVTLWIAAYLLVAITLGSLIGRRIKDVNAYQLIPSEAKERANV